MHGHFFFFGMNTARSLQAERSDRLANVHSQRDASGNRPGILLTEITLESSYPESEGWGWQGKQSGIYAVRLLSTNGDNSNHTTAFQALQHPFSKAESWHTTHQAD